MADEQDSPAGRCDGRFLSMPREPYRESKPAANAKG